MTDADRELVSRLPDDRPAIREELGLARLATDEPYYERLLLEPVLNVNGLDSGYQGEGSKTVLPVLGGSLPAAFFRRVDVLADVPVLVVPYANADQGNHSPNEHLDLNRFENGVRTTAAVLERIARADATVSV